MRIFHDIAWVTIVCAGHIVLWRVVCAFAWAIEWRERHSPRRRRCPWWRSP